MVPYVFIDVLEIDFHSSQHCVASKNLAGLHMILDDFTDLYVNMSRSRTPTWSGSLFDIKVGYT